MDNYRSATNPETRATVEKQIIEELEHGNYIITDKKPCIVSAIGAIPKPNTTDIRIIHDCSHPVGSSVNDFASCDPMKYQNLDEAVKMSSHRCYYAKLDLKSAYRSVNIHPDDYPLTGLKWYFNQNSATYMYDTKLPFGARKSPGIFNRLTQCVKRMMINKGFSKIIAYLDDFLIISDNKEECRQGLSTLIFLLRKLGFKINWKKVVDPCQVITFLGIELNSLNQTLSLPSEKLCETKDLINDFAKRTRASKRQLQSLAGKLNWTCQVVRGGRSYLRRILDLMNQLKQPYHKIKLTKEFKADISWWQNFLKIFNGKAMFIKQSLVNCVQIDACNMGSGVSFQDDWLYTNWTYDWPEMAKCHINLKEAASVILAARRWAPYWSNSCVYIYSDSQCTVSMINKGSTKSPMVMDGLRELFWLSAIYNFHVKCLYIPGHVNHTPDAISRLHQPGQFVRLQTVLRERGGTLHPLTLRHHMSNKSLSFLIPQICKWLAWN